MAFKLDRYHRDYLFWIYPLIILGLIFFAFNRDDHNRKSAAQADTNVNVDSSVTINSKTVLVDSLRIKKYNDGISIFYATKNDY